VLALVVSRRFGWYQDHAVTPATHLHRTNTEELWWPHCTEKGLCSEFLLRQNLDLVEIHTRKLHVALLYRVTTFDTCSSINGRCHNFLHAMLLKSFIRLSKFSGTFTRSSPMFLLAYKLELALGTSLVLGIECSRANHLLCLFGDTLIYWKRCDRRQW